MRDPKPETERQQAALERLRDRRVRPDADLSLAFLPEQFRREVARPFKQLGDLARLWESRLPAEVAAGTRLESLQRGVLTVSVDTASRMYDLDRRLREGLEQELITSHRGAAFRRVKLQVDAGRFGSSDDGR
ncbi:MAG: DciA family protein [Planctomycetota bacterium]